MRPRRLGEQTRSSAGGRGGAGLRHSILLSPLSLCHLTVLTACSVPGTVGGTGDDSPKTNVLAFVEFLVKRKIKVVVGVGD